LKRTEARQDDESQGKKKDLEESKRTLVCEDNRKKGAEGRVNGGYLGL
jgi:hypothetical protein